jgi:predicted transcriptional regulator YdeE
MSLATALCGPFRAIGVRYEGKNQNQEVMQLWTQFLPRCSDISKAENAAAFGICRCLPGVTDGSFEYIAAFQARPDAPVPEGMMGVDIPRGEYLVHKFDSAQGYQQAWQEAAGAVAADAEWTGYCNGPDDCQCATHPCFEYYPPEFRGSGTVYIYIPVRRK